MGTLHIGHEASVHLDEDLLEHVFAVLTAERERPPPGTSDRDRTKAGVRRADRRSEPRIPPAAVVGDERVGVAGTP